MTRLFALPEAVLLQIYSKLSPQELYNLIMTGDSQMKRLNAIKALFQQDSLEATRWKIRLMEYWVYKSERSLMPSKKLILRAMNRFLNQPINLYLGFSLINHSCEDKRFNDILEMMSKSPLKFDWWGWAVNGLPLMTLTQINSVLEPFMVFFTKDLGRGIFVLERLKNRLLKEKSLPIVQVGLMLFSDEQNRASQTKGSRILRILSEHLTMDHWDLILDNLLKYIQKDQMDIDLIRLMLLSPELTQKQILTCYNWAVEHINDGNSRVKCSAFVLASILVPLMTDKQLKNIVNIVVNQLSKAGNFINTPMHTLITNLLTLIPASLQEEPKEGPQELLLDPIVTQLKNEYEPVARDGSLHLIRLLLLFRPEVLAPQSETLIKLIRGDGKRYLAPDEIQLIEKLSGHLNPHQELAALVRPLEYPFSKRDQAIQLLPVFEKQMLPHDLETMIHWALDNLHSVNYEVRDQAPQVVGILASRITPEQLAPRLQRLTTSNDTVGTKKALRTLGIHMDPQKLAPLFPWFVTQLETPQQEFNEVIMCLLPVFVNQINPKHMLLASDLLFNALQNQNDVELVQAATQLLPKFANIFTMPQLDSVLSWVFEKLEDDSDDNAMVFENTKNLFEQFIIKMHDKQLFNLFTLLIAKLEAHKQSNENLNSEQLALISIVNRYIKNEQLTKQLTTLIERLSYELKQEVETPKSIAAFVLLAIEDRCFIETKLLIAKKVQSIYSSCCITLKVQLDNLFNALLSDSKTWKDGVDILFPIPKPDQKEDQLWNRCAINMLRSWILDQLQNNFNDDNSYVASTHLNQVLGYLKTLPQFKDRGFIGLCEQVQDSALPFGNNCRLGLGPTASQDGT